MMEDQDLGVTLEDTQSASFTDSANEKLDFQKKLISESDNIVSIIEDAFPRENKGKPIGNPQADALRFSERIFYLWVWPIIAIRRFRDLINRMDFVQPYAGNDSNSYVVKDTETVYTMTKDAFSGKGGMKFFGIRFMSIWVFPMAITGLVMELLFVSPMKGVNPFG